MKQISVFLHLTLQGAVALYSEFANNDKDINILHPHVDVEGRFLAFALNNRKKELIKRIKGTTVRHLQNKDLFDVVINIPKSKEQEKIAELLLSFDHLITLHQRKY